MTSTPSCPEFSLLSQFLDGDLEKSQAHQLSQHVGSCPYCQAQIRDLEHAQEWERSALSAAQNPISQSTSATSCLSSETLFAYARGSLSPTDERTVDAHILACGVCLSEVREVMRAAADLATVNLQSVPAELNVRIESQWVIPSALPRLVIQLTHEGLRLIDKYLTAPLLDVQEVLIPLPAYRSQSTSDARRSATALGLRLDAGETEISVAAVREQHGVVVKLTLIGTEQKALGGRRIFLRQGSRAVFSEQTNDQGVLFMPLLAPGTYEVSCHEIRTAFLLELRP
jgi:anti-sigma factor RsiW